MAEVSPTRSSSSSRVQLGDVVVDMSGHKILREGKAEELEPRAWEMLLYLIRNPGVLVSKEDLRKHVWDDVVVGEAAISQALLRIRRAIGDTAKAPKYVETLHRRGFRLIAPLSWVGDGSQDASESGLGQLAELPVVQEVGSARLTQPKLAPSATSRIMHGGQAERDEVWRAWQRAQAGGQEFVFVKGVAGSGKTALIEAFIERLRIEVAEDQYYLARVKCVEDLGPGESFLPILDILMQLSTSDHELISIAKTVAGGWLGLLTGASKPGVGQTPAGGTQLLRESVLALSEICARRQLIICVDDLHWCDPSSLALLNYVIQSRRLSRILVVGTWRADMANRSDRTENGITHFTRRLYARGYCQVVELKPLSETEVAQWTRSVCGDIDGCSELTRFVYQWSGGRPLFAEAILEYVAERSQSSSVNECLAELAILGLPSMLRDTVQVSLTTLSDEERQVISACSVMTADFFVSEIQFALGITNQGANLAIDQICERLLCSGILVQRGLGYNNARGEIDHRFNFGNSLYRKVVYDSLRPDLRRSMHRRMGQYLSHEYAGKLHMSAAIIAHHYQRSGDSSLAASFYELAGENVMGRGGYNEAYDYFQSGLEQLELMPASQARDQAELNLRIRSAIVQAYTEKDTGRQRNLRVAVSLAGQIWQLKDGLQQLCSLYRVLFLQYAPRPAESIEKNLSYLSTRDNDPVSKMKIDFVLGCQNFLRGDMVCAQELFDASERAFKMVQSDLDLAIGRAQHNASMAFEAHEFALRLKGLRAWVTLFSGDAQKALRMLDDCRTLARSVGNEPAEFVITLQRLQIYQLLGDVEAAEFALQEINETNTKVPIGLRETAGLHHFWVDAMRGRVVDTHILEAAWANYLGVKNAALFPLAGLVAVETCLQTSEVELGLGMIRSLKAEITERGIYRDDARLLHLEAELLSKQTKTRPGQVSDMFAQAQLLAEKQGNRFWLHRILATHQ